MGVDIHMCIINSQGDYVCNDIFDGRDYEWFDNICGRGDVIYDAFPFKCGLPALVPNDIQDDFNNSGEFGYYGFHYVIVQDFNRWFCDKKPHISAGWVSTYDQWMYENKHVYPTQIVCHLSSEMAETNDYHFVELIDEYQGSLWLYNFIKDHDIPDDAMIVYYFDC